MADEIKQLIDMVANLKIIVEEGFEDIDKRFEKIDQRFEKVDQRFDGIEASVEELRSNQMRMLNSIKSLERDVVSNKKHIERLEEKESYL